MVGRCAGCLQPLRDLLARWLGGEQASSATESLLPIKQALEPALAKARPPPAPPVPAPASVAEQPLPAVPEDVPEPAKPEPAKPRAQQPTWASVASSKAPAPPSKAQVAPKAAAAPKATAPPPKAHPPPSPLSCALPSPAYPGQHFGTPLQTPLQSPLGSVATLSSNGTSSPQDAFYDASQPHSGQSTPTVPQTDSAERLAPAGHS